MLSFIALLGAVAKDIDQEKVFETIKGEPLDELEIMQLQAHGFINEDMSSELKIKALKRALDNESITSKFIQQCGYIANPLPPESNSFVEPCCRQD